MYPKCPITGYATTETHHIFGRIGDLYTEPLNLLPVSADGHVMIEVTSIKDATYKGFDFMIKIHGQEFVDFANRQSHRNRLWTNYKSERGLNDSD